MKDINIQNDIQVAGTLINYYFNCKRQCYLMFYHMNIGQDHFLLDLGRFYHEQFEDKQKLIIDNIIAIDKIQKDFVIEYKKSNSNTMGTKYQLLFYLYILKQHGINKKGLIKFKENKKNIEVILTEQEEKNLKKIIQQIKELIKQPAPPKPIYKTKCKKCAYFDFCFS